ncbi:MAG: DNA internalization-related competence protein ComEC/Rec2 [Gammaproteobacteria bacterium]|nr:DNA internalization-related competence protein ComEC/Rec2 [Gammaproteobacteria bacterium]
MRSIRAEPDWQRHPLTLALGVSFGAGALLMLPRLPGLPWLLAVSLPALLPWRGRALYALWVLGFQLAAWRAGAALQDRWPAARDGEVVQVSGAVADLPETVGEVGAPMAWRFAFAPQPRPGLPRRVRAAWYHTGVVPQGGQCWHFSLKLKSPHGSADPGAFDYERWLFARGFGATATVRQGHPCGAAPGYGWLRLRERLRQFLERCLAGVPGQALVETMVLGDRSRLTQEDWDVFRATGTSHLVAVAGLHLAIIATAAFFVLRWLWVVWPGLALRLPAQKAALIGAVALAVGYAALTGFALPAVRASLMLVAAAAALPLGGVRSLLRALALAWLFIIVFDPLALLGASLWLSFGAVALIVWITYGRVGPPRAWRQALGLQLGLSLGLIPLTLWFFGSASWSAPLANLFVVPAALLLLPATLATLLPALVWPSFGVPLLKAAALGWYAVREVLGWIAAQAPPVAATAAGQPVVLLLALFGIVLLLAPRALPVRPLGLACLLPLLLPATRPPPVGNFEIAVLDVGEGLSALVRTHRHALLFDTGPKYPGGLDMGEAVVVPYLHEAGVRRLDLLLISHRDLDHRGGAPAVRAALPVAAELGALAATPCRDGQRWIWDGVSFAILNPPAATGGSHNNRGCVLRVGAGGHAALLPADIEAPAERRLLQDHPRLLHADLLLAPHHGSAGSSTPAFVAAVTPALVIYPAGWHNQFHFPRPQPRARYAAVGARQLQTGVEGAIRVEIGSTGVNAVDRYRCRHPRLWRVPPAGC